MMTEDSWESDERGEDESEERNPYGKVIQSKWRDNKLDKEKEEKHSGGEEGKEIREP